MSKGKWFCLLLILAALAAGVVVGEFLKTNTMTMVVINGKVYPTPNSGDMLTWTTPDGNPTLIKFAGPPNSGKSPCKEDENTPSSTCHVKFKTPILKMYYYDCPTCTDPGYAGPHANGRLEVLKGEVPFGPAPASSRNGGNTYHGEAYPNGQSSAVYYYPPDGSSPSTFLPIPVATYASTTETDQIIFDPPGASWKVVMANNTCKEQANGGIIGSSGSSTCTVLSTAMPQYYCVIYGSNAAGIAELDVNTTRPMGNPPTPTCTY